MRRDRGERSSCEETDRFAAQPQLNLFVEFRQWAALSLRLEADNVLAQRYDRIAHVYSGRRDASPLTYVEDRRLTSSPSLLVSARKAF